jgi:hypothetical protein
MFGKSALCLVLLICADCCGRTAESPHARAISDPRPPSSGVAATPASSDAVPETPPSAARATEFPKTPPELRVPTTSTLILKARGRGVQIYECAATAEDPAALAWKLRAPEADLFDERGHKVAHHFAGPTWQATDGSSVVGNVVAKADAPDPQAIPWLMLSATERKGPGKLASVTHIQRLDTSGGKAPTFGCDAAHLKAEVRVPYEATYHFYSS